MKVIKLIFIVLLFPIFIFSSTEINNKLKLDINTDGQLTVYTRYLTNYLLRGVDESNNETGSLLLIKRNEKAVNFDMADLEWDGFYPSVDFKLPAFEYQTTSIDLSNYNYPNNITWDNSGLSFRGASLAQLVTDFPSSKEERIDALILFLMNSLTVAETAGSVLKSGSDLDIGPSVQLMNKLTTLAEKIENFQELLEEANTILPFVDLFLVQIENLAKAANIDIENEDLNNTLYTTYNYYKLFREAYDKLYTVLNVNIPSPDLEVTSKANETIKAQFKLLIKNEIDENTQDILGSYVDSFASKYSSAVDEETKYDLILRYSVEPFSKILVTYRIYLEKQLKDLDKDSEVYTKKKNQIKFLRNGFALIQLTRFIFASDDFLELVKKEPQKVVPFVVDIAEAVVLELLDLDNAEIIAKKTLQLATGADGRSSTFRKIGSATKAANTYMKAFDVGSDVGNKMIPLLWDLILGENSLKTSIVDGQISNYGAIKTNIRVDINNSEVNTFSNTSNSNDIYIAAAEGDTLDIYASMIRPKMFDETRSSWLLNMSQAPTTVYELIIYGNSRYETTLLCTKKVFGNLDYSVHSYNISTPAQPCGEGSLLGGSAFDEIDNQSFYNHSNLPDKYKLDSDIISSNTALSSFSYVVKQEDIDANYNVSTLGYSALEANNITHKIFIVQKNKDTSFQTAVDEQDYKTITMTLDDIEGESNDKIETIVWSFGDGSDIEGSLKTTSHTYTQDGKYDLSVKVYRKSGQILSYSKTIEVKDSNLNVPPPIANAGVDKAVSNTQVVTLDGSDSNDSDGNIVSYEWSENGTVLSTQASFTKSDFSVGIHTLTLKVTDDDGDSSTDTMTLIISNQAPVVTSQTLSLDQDRSLDITLGGSDADNNTLTYHVKDQPTNGTLSGTAPNLTYTPNSGFYGTDSFTYYINDTITDSSSATISITINEIEKVAKITSLDKTQAVINESITFTVTGENLPTTIAMSLESAECGDVFNISSTSASITCIPRSIGDKEFYVKIQSGGEFINGSTSLKVEVISEDQVVYKIPIFLEDDMNISSKYISTSYNGEVLYSYNNVDVYSNYNEANNGSYSFLAGDYQCTELIKRFYNSVFDVPIVARGNGQDVARNFDGAIGSHNDIDVKVFYYENDTSSYPPVNGSIISFDNNDNIGHVAIVKKVEEQTDGSLKVYLAEQNWAYTSSSDGLVYTAHSRYITFTKQSDGNWYGVDDSNSSNIRDVIGYTRIFAKGEIPIITLSTNAPKIAGEEVTFTASLSSALDEAYNVKISLGGGADNYLEPESMSANSDRTSFSYTRAILTAGDRVYKVGIYQGDTLVSIFTEGTYTIEESNSEVDLDSGLVAHYEFEDDANDSSGNEHHGIEYGQISYSDGVIGKAVNFDGNYNKYIRVPHESSLNFNSSFSISLWVKSTKDTGVQFLLSKGRDIYSHYAISSQGKQFRLNYSNSYADIASASVKKDDYLFNKFHHIVGVANSNNSKINYYLDGKLIDSKTLEKEFNITTSHDLIFGRHDTFNDGSSSWAYPFSGSLDELRIYNRALNEKEIEELYDFGDIE